MTSSHMRAILVTGALVVGLAACSGADAPTVDVPATPAAADNAIANAPALATGSFSGRSDHVTTGMARIVRNADGAMSLVLGEDFSLDGAPDPHVGIGNAGSYDPQTGELGALADLAGLQSYALPREYVLGEDDEVYIWCNEFSVPLGVAPLSPAS